MQHIDQLRKQRNDLKLQIEALNDEYGRLIPGSVERMAMGATIAALRIEFSQLQKEIIKLSIILPNKK